MKEIYVHILIWSPSIVKISVLLTEAAADIDVAALLDNADAGNMGRLGLLPKPILNTNWWQYVLGKESGGLFCYSL
jgi:hypothetical protein